MLIYPQINTVALTIGPLKVHWYGVMYLLAFLAALMLGHLRARHSRGRWSKTLVSDLIFYCITGVIIGGRLGYVFFYTPTELIANPLTLFKVWQGGMSFHGGLLGVVIAMWFFSRRYQKTFFEVSDFVAPLVPIGIALGRAGNFINGELWGRVTDLPWAMIYPHVDNLPRHPSQLYEFFGEGIVLFVIVWLFSAKPRPAMAVSGMFGLGYGLVRFVLEFFRQPDQQYGFIAFNWLTMGQLLSIPLILAGLIMLGLAYRNRRIARYV